jgi:hypothetical protein
MESYIDKLGHDFNRNKAPRRHHPLDPKALKLRLRAKDDVAPAQLTQRYQSLIGKLLYRAGRACAPLGLVPHQTTCSPPQR